MFLTNKYSKAYFSLIERAQNRHNIDYYTERHHIIPRSLGGTNDSSNIAILTAKEHFVAHHLLTKMCNNAFHTSSMWNAFFLMHFHSTKCRHWNSRTYAFAKERMSANKKDKTGEKNHFYGQMHSEETREIMRAKRRGRVCRRDWKLYDFIHNDFGFIRCARFELCEKYDLPHAAVYSIVNGKSYKGWRLKGNDIRITNNTYPRGISRTQNGKKFRVRVAAKHYGTFDTLLEAIAALEVVNNG